MPYIAGEYREQHQLLPERLEDYVGEENPVRVIDAFVDSLDMKAMGFTKTDLNRRGAPSYNPADLAKLYLYGYTNTVRTSRKLERETHINVEVIWLMKKLKPDFKTIADFRKENKKNGLEVNYNVQIAVDEKNKLVLAADVTNKPADQGHLNDMAQAAKETLGMDVKGKLDVLADKGYYQGEDLKECDKNGTITYVTHQAYSNATGNREYYGDRFKYNSEEDVYICPEGEKLYRTKHKKKDLDRVQYKNFRACQKCPNKDFCTKSKKGRVISRSKHQNFLDTVDARTAQNMDKYLKRQMIVEHPFGTVKRTMNAGHFLTRGLESVNGETHLVFLAYNMKRVINILGVKEILKRFEVKKALALLYLRKKQHVLLDILNSEKHAAVF